MDLSNDEKSKILAKAIANGEITSDQAAKAVRAGMVDQLLATLKTDIGDVVAAELVPKYDTSKNVGQERNAVAQLGADVAAVAAPHAPPIDPAVALGMQADANIKARRAAP
jgi:hypothetical protein